MRRNRIIWFVLLILSLIAISYYGGPISYGFFYAMLIIPILSLLYLLYVYIFFHIYQYKDGGQYAAGDAFTYKFKLMNEFFIPFVGIRVGFFDQFSTINGLSDETEYELMPNTGIIKETTIVCHYRGEYNIGIKEVEIQDFFRLFRVKYINNSFRRISINPRLVSLKKLGTYEMHSKDAMKYASKLDVLTREYVPGDDVRFINWNQSARTGNLMVRERIGEEGSGVSIVMDVCRYSKDIYEYIPVENKILELALAISLYFCSKSIESNEYHLCGDLITNIIDNNLQFEHLYKQMSSLAFDASNTQELLFEKLINYEPIFHSSVVYIILPKISNSAEKMIKLLAERNIYTVVYVIGNPSEMKVDVEKNDLVDIKVISQEAKLEEVSL